MAFRERDIVGFVFDVDGVPIINGKISAKITLPIGYTATHIVIDRIVTILTQTDGSFVLSVWCDEDSLIPVDIELKFPIINNGNPDDAHIKIVSMAYEDGSDKDIGTLIIESLSAVPIADTIPATSLIDSRILAKGTPVTDYAIRGIPNQVWHGSFIDHNLCAPHMYVPSAVLGDCWVEADIMVHPDNVQGVIWDVGNGGSHPILLEAIKVSTGIYRLYANMFNGSTNIEANSIDTIKSNTWHRVAYAVIGDKLCILLDGHLTAMTTFAGSRTVGSNAFDGHFYILASGEHQGANIWVRNTRIFEEVNGFGLPYGADIPQAYTPQRVMSDKWNNVDSVANWDLTKPQNRIIDSSRGYNGSKNSMFRSVGTGIQNQEESVLPQWEVKPFILPTFTDTPTTTPTDSDWFDAFDDDNATLFTHDGQGAAYYPSISNRTIPTGQVWTGSAGAFAVSNIGLLEGNAVSTEFNINNSAEAKGTLSVKAVEITFNSRVNVNGFSIFACYTDANNFVQMAFSTSVLTWIRRVAGVSTFVAGGSFTSGATTGVITRSGDTLTVVIAGSTFNLDVSALSTANGFGIAVGALQRMKSFSVKAL